MTLERIFFEFRSNRFLPPSLCWDKMGAPCFKTFTLAIVIVSLCIAVDSLPKCNFDTYYCQTCDKVRQCPSNKNTDIMFVCPKHHHCYLMGRFLCASDECWQAEETSWKFDCPGQGRHPDRKNCTKSFTCVRHYNGSYLKLRDDCPEGLQFDARERTCTKPEVANCHRGLLYLEKGMMHTYSDGYRCEKVGVFPDPDSKEYFHICEMDDYVLTDRKLKCPDGKAFNALLSRCEYVSMLDSM